MKHNERSNLWKAITAKKSQDQSIHAVRALFNNWASFKTSIIKTIWMTINDKRNVFSWCIRIITTRTHVSTSSFSNHHCNDKTFWFQPYLQASLFMIIFKKGWKTLCTVCTIVWKIRKLRIAHQLLPYNTSWNIHLKICFVVICRASCEHFWKYWHLWIKNDISTCL